MIGAKENLSLIDFRMAMKKKKISVNEWCMSSFPASIFCPSNVDKSTQPWPLHTSISYTNNDNIPIKTDIISSTFFSPHENKETTDSLLISSSSSSSSSSSFDYYTNRRIEQLHDRMDEIQMSSFLKFINYHLSSKNDPKLVKDLSQDLSNGHVLLDLIEIFSSTKLKREHGRTRFHSLTNVQYVLDYLKLHMQHINITPQEIVAGNRKQILALLWMIMKIFDFPAFRITPNKQFFNENTLFSFGHDRTILLKWINQVLNKILQTRSSYVKDFHPQTWLESEYLLLMIKYLSPLSLKYGTVEYFEYFKRLDQSDVNGRERLELCLKCSNYCFETSLIVEQIEKNFFRFFSELQQNIFFILKSNQIGKLTKSNPYTKQLFETIATIEQEPIIIINDDQADDYLIENQSMIDTEQSTMITNGILAPSMDVIEEQLCHPIPSPISTDTDHLRTRKLKKKCLPVSVEKLSSISPTLHNDLLVKIFDCLRNPKLLTLKYLLIFSGVCFSILIIFLQK